MPRPSAPFMHAIWAAFVLAVVASAAEQAKPPSMIGQTREQVVEHMGDPKSNLKAGTREVLFYNHLKLTLRNGVVIDSEVVADEPPRRAPEPAPTTTGSTTTPTTGAPATAAAPAPATPAPATPPVPFNNEGAGSVAASPPAEQAAPPKPVKPPEPEVEIKFIKSGPSTGKASPRPSTKAATTPVAQQPAAKAAPAATADSKSAPPTPVTAPTVAATDDKPVVTDATPAVKSTTETPAPAEEPAAEATAAKPVDPKLKAAVRRRWASRSAAEADDETVQMFSTQSYVIAAIIMIAGIGYIVWRRNQKNLELAASAVSHAPFEAAAATDSAGHFTADLVGKLGAKRFERLVASYYAKTGVVAERTNATGDSPVQIKIFWKGEPKPFAGVQCHANPPTLIGAKPLQDLFTALSAAEIRRGYVVTTGKFNVEARDYAEEKHFTLLSGDIFLEKLNALPPAARAELLKETNTEEPASSAGAATIG
jgi:hypothetical protein